MPKILSYTPAWLSRPSPGFNLFSATPGSDSGRRNSTSRRPTSDEIEPTKGTRGPRRVIARRGTEAFVVVKNQIRWADLSYIKNEWEEANEHGRCRRSHSVSNQSASFSSDRGSEGPDGPSYRILKVPVSEEIRQLVTSPNGNFLAILTSHTVHVAILPDPSHLGGPDTGPIRLKAHTLGPTAHVLSQSPVISALWHPLGVSGNCLVTITAEAVVRVWELAAENRWSFDNPSLAVDLKKLVDGSSVEEDFSVSKMGRSKGFSPDSFEMEVAAACFGGRGSSQESGWAPMTLWIAMSEGDVYALCPLLPSRWQPPPTLIPSLSVSIVSKSALINDDSNISKQEKQDTDQQFAWMSDLDNQEPVFVAKRSEFDPDIATYIRPAKPGAIPKLQGPFEIESIPDDDEDELDVMLTDIYVAAAKLDIDELMFEEDSNAEFETVGEDGLSVAVVCLLNTNGRVHVCIDIDGVEGKWLPNKKSKSRFALDYDEAPSLLTFESLDTLRASELELSQPMWPLFSADPYSRYSFYVTHGHGIAYMSLSTWTENLESEFKNNSDSGVDFRMAIFTQGSSTLRERIFNRRQGLETGSDGQNSDLTASVVFLDSDLGYLLLTAEENQPHAVILDSPEIDGPVEGDTTVRHDYGPDRQDLVVSQPRETYQPPSAFWAESPLPAFLETHANGRLKRSLTEEIRLSQATLSLMTDAHKVLSDHTYRLGVAASELFRRCERLQEEFRDQIKRSNEIAERIESVTGEDADDLGSDQEQELRGNTAIERRMEKAQARQADLIERYDALRRKVARNGGRPLSDKEKAWGLEVKQLRASVLEPDEESHGGKRRSAEGENAPWKRYQEAKHLASEVISQAREILQNTDADTAPDSRSEHDKAATTTPAASTIKVPSDIRRMKMAQVMKLLERESALVDATKNRLGRLTLSSSSN